MQQELTTPMSTIISIEGSSSRLPEIKLILETERGFYKGSCLSLQNPKEVERYLISNGFPNSNSITSSIENNVLNPINSIMTQYYEDIIQHRKGGENSKGEKERKAKFHQYQDEIRKIIKDQNVIYKPYGFEWVVYYQLRPEVDKIRWDIMYFHAIQTVTLKLFHVP